MEPRGHDETPGKELEPEQSKIVDRDLAEVFPPRNQIFTSRERLLQACKLIIEQQIEVGGLALTKSTDPSGVPTPLRILMPAITDMIKDFNFARQRHQIEMFERTHPAAARSHAGHTLEECKVDLHHLKLVKKMGGPQAAEQAFFALEARTSNRDWFFLDSTNAACVVASEHPVLTVALSKNGGSGYSFLPIYSQAAVNRFIDRFIEPKKFIEYFPESTEDKRHNLPPHLLRHIQSQIFSQLDESRLKRHDILSPADIVVSSMDYTGKPDDQSHQFPHHYLAYCQVNQSFDVKCNVNPENGLLLDS